MSIYLDAMGNVKSRQLEALAAFAKKHLDMEPDPKVLRADFERYFNDGTDQGALLEQELRAKYGDEVFQREWLLKARRADG